MKKKFLFVAVLLLFPVLLFSQQKVTVSGYVKDAKSGEAVIGAIVFSEDKSVGVQANEFGFYSITVPVGQKTIICSCVGFVNSEFALPSGKNSVKHDFEIVEDTEQIEASQVFSKSKKDVLKLPQMGAQTLSAVSVKKLPALMGEPDIIKVIQMLPGVQTPSEGSTGFSVRGGGVDQNLVLMDGAPIFNCGHFLGFFSMFNGDAVKNAQLYKGDFPARYGGRTSSVLDISTVDGNMNKFGGSASIGLIASKIFLEGPIVKDKVSFMFSARRSYLDIFFPLLRNQVNPNSKLSFYDINAKVNWAINEKNRIYLSAFNSRDIFGLAMETLKIDLMAFNYRNSVQSLRWNHVFSDKVFSNLTAYHSQYKAGIDNSMTNASFEWRSRLGESGLKFSTTCYLGSKNTLEFGANLANVVLQPSETHPTAEDSFVNDVVSPWTYGINPGGYIQNETKFGKLICRYGLRYSSFTKTGKTLQYYYDPETHEKKYETQYGSGEIISFCGGLEPRASLSLSVSDNTSLKAAYSRSLQFLQQAVVSVSGSVLDAWFTASPNVKPQISDQFSAGFNQNFLNDALEFSVEGFYKNNKNTIDLKDNPGVVIDNPDREGLLRFGKSWAYGVEGMLKFEFSKVNGWVAYTWSKAFNQINGINDGQPYRSPINHEHSVNAVITYDITKRLCASASWVFYSGSPTTFPVARFRYQNVYVPIYAGRNTDSMPDYHRLDLSLTLKSKKRAEGKRWSSEWNFSAYNAYARHNAWSISTAYNSTSGMGEAYMVYLFSIVPSVSYNINF